MANSKLNKLTKNGITYDLQDKEISDKLASINGIVKDNAGTLTAAVEGTDYGYPLLKGAGAPSTSTIASVGQHYFDTSAIKAPYEYVCVAAGSSYTWIEAGGSWQSNRNFLDNYYFADPVDQRDEYVVPPGTAYYSDTGLTAKVGTLSAYARFIAANSTYGKITLNGTDYYTATSAARHGYVSTEYRSTIDRWMADSGCFTRDSVGLIAKTNGASIRNLLENKSILSGRTLTASVLLETTGLVTTTIENYNKSNAIYFGSNKTIITQGEYQSRFFELVLPTDEHVIAVKVELGS